MKKESLGDKYKTAVKRISKLEEDDRHLVLQISKLSKLTVTQDIMLGERNMKIQKMKEGIINV